MSFNGDASSTTSPSSSSGYSSSSVDEVEAVDGGHNDVGEHAGLLDGSSHSLNNGGEHGSAAKMPPHGKSGMLKSYLNLVTGAIGVGILSYPYAFMSAGIVLNVIYTIVFVIINFLTLRVLYIYGEAFLPKMRQATYEELVRAVLGRKLYLLSVAFVLFITIGALTGFLIVIGDLGHPVISHWAGDDAFVGTRTFIIIIFCVVIIFPLSMFGDIDSLAFSSFFAIVSVFAVCVIIIVRGIISVAEGGSEVDHVKAVNPSVQVVIAIPLVVFSLGCHLQLLPVYGELKQEQRPKMGYVIGSGVMSCAVLYSLVGIFGYLHFGSHTKGDVLVNFGLSDIPGGVAKLLMAGHIALAYPIALFPATKAIRKLFPFLRWKGKYNWWRSSLETAIINISMMILTGAMAILLPKVQVVFGLVGSTASVALNFGFPALLLLRASSRTPQLPTIPNPTTGLEPSEEGNVSVQHMMLTSASNSKLDRMWDYIDGDKGRLVTGWLILLMSILIGVCGTGVTIYQDWF